MYDRFLAYEELWGVAVQLLPLLCACVEQIGQCSGAELLFSPTHLLLIWCCSSLCSSDYHIGAGKNVTLLCQQLCVKR